MKKKALDPPEFDPEDKLGPDNPYPEFEDELFGGFLRDGLKPEQLTEPERTKYKTWLAARTKRQ